jgi:hypothetical protein
MAKGPEVRMSQGTVFGIIAVIAVVYFLSTGGFGAKTPVTPSQPGDQPPLVIVPAIEKTKVYVSTFDAADFAVDKQKNRVAGTADLIKSGNVLETITTTTTSGAASASELNGGDVFSILGVASGYYAEATENVKVAETNQPVETFIKKAAAASVSLLDENKNTVTGPYEFNLSTNDVSKTYYVRVERPGDKSWYQLCLIASDYNDDLVQVQVKDTTGSYNKGILDLVDQFDNLKNNGMDAVWKYDMPVKNYDQLDIPFIVKTAKDIDPSGTAVVMNVVDCEKNLQGGKIVYSDQDGADADVGLANINLSISIV